MNTRLDIHTHTIASGHAYSSLREMAKAASQKGLVILGITDHTPGVPGCCDPLYFTNFKTIPRTMYGIRLLLGAELNILDASGRLSLSNRMIDFLDVRIAGIHNSCYQNATRRENTDAVVNVIKNPRIDIICHPHDGAADIDFEHIVMAAKQHHVLLELNNNSLNPQNKKMHAYENACIMLKSCKMHGQPVLLSSDAHFDEGIADYSFIDSVLEETDFPQELIINYDETRFLEYLAVNRAKL